MINYFKVFRIRKFGGQIDDITRQRPEERYVFFDDSDRAEIEAAAARARNLKATMELRYPARVCVWRQILGVKAQGIGEFV